MTARINQRTANKSYTLHCTRVLCVVILI